MRYQYHCCFIGRFNTQKNIYSLTKSLLFKQKYNLRVFKSHYKNVCNTDWPLCMFFSGKAILFVFFVQSETNLMSFWGLCLLHFITSKLSEKPFKCVSMHGNKQQQFLCYFQSELESCKGLKSNRSSGRPRGKTSDSTHPRKRSNISLWTLKQCSQCLWIMCSANTSY